MTTFRWKSRWFRCAVVSFSLLFASCVDWRTSENDQSSLGGDEDNGTSIIDRPRLLTQDSSDLVRVAVTDTSRPVVQNMVDSRSAPSEPSGEVGPVNRPLFDDTSEIFTLREVGLLAQIGMDESGDRSAVLHRPIDAAFVRDRVVVLDASAPWVRVYDRNGTFIRSLVRHGQGPGEVTQPIAIAATVEGGFLLTHTRGVERFASAGTLLQTIRISQHGLRGSTEGCNGELLVLAQRIGQWDAPVGVLAEVREDGVLVDTLLALSPVRLNGTQQHPLYLLRGDRGFLFYSEQSDRPSLLDITCRGEIRREYLVDPLGPGENVGNGPGGTIAVSLPRPPFPAGILRVGEHVVWGMNVVRDAAGSVDSLTVLDVLGEGGERRRVHLRGWYQLLDSDPDGTILISNTWGYGRTWGLLPGIFLIDGQRLLQLCNC